jgi:hypothetical protein
MGKRGNFKHTPFIAVDIHIFVVVVEKFGSRFHGQFALINDSTPNQTSFAPFHLPDLFCVTAYDCSRYLSRFVGPFYFSTPMIFQV